MVVFMLTIGLPYPLSCFDLIPTTFKRPFNNRITVTVSLAYERIPGNCMQNNQTLAFGRCLSNKTDRTPFHPGLERGMILMNICLISENNNVVSLLL